MDDSNEGFYITDDDFTPSEHDDEIPVNFIQKRTETDNNPDDSRNDNKIKINAKLLIIVSLIIIICVAIVCVFPNLQSEYRNSNAKSDLISNCMLSINSDSVLQFESFEKGTVCLTQSTVEYIYSGGVTKKNTHTYINPAIKTAGDYVLVFDRGKTDYRCEKDGKIQNTAVAENNIITAAITSRGAYAVAYLGNNCTSVLSVYSSTGKEVFKWECSDNYISDISLSENGEKVAVSLVQSQNGSLTGIIKIFNINYNSEYVTFELDDIAVSSKWFSSKKNMIVCKNGIYLIDSDSITNIYSFTNDYFEYYYFVDDKLYISAENNSDSSVHNIICISSRGKIIYNVTAEGKVRDISGTDKYASVLCSDKIYTFNSKGETVGETDNLKYSVGVVSQGNKNFVLGVNGVYKYSAYGNAEIEKTEQITGIEQIEKE